MPPRLSPELSDDRVTTRGPARSLRRHQTITLSLLFLAGVVNFLDR